MRTPTAFAAAVVFMSSTVVFADDPLVWDNGDADTLPLIITLPASIVVFGEVTDNAIADDFMLGTDTSISRVQWTGAVVHSLLGPHPPFVIKFYATNPTNGLPIGAPGDPGEPVLASYFIPPESIGTLPDSNYPDFELHFVTDLPTPFIASADTHYWISVQGYFDLSTWYGSPRFGWMQSTTQQLDVIASSVGGWQYAPDTGEFGDLAFKLYGTPVPAPGALALLGMAGLITRRRRRA